jgi:hypothetical protein
MKSDTNRGVVRNLGRIALGIAVAVLSVGCGHMLSHVIGSSAHATKPAESEFGAGPRASRQHVYVAQLQPTAPLLKRRLQNVPVRITDASGKPVDGATITIDGGMPEHGHGLPTQPRVTRALGDGVYEIEGLRFNMGGWWEVKLEIASSAGIDNVTFNLDL